MSYRRNGASKCMTATTTDENKCWYLRKEIHNTHLILAIICPERDNNQSFINFNVSDIRYVMQRYRKVRK